MRNRIKQILQKRKAALPDASTSRASKSGSVSAQRWWTCAVLLSRFIKRKTAQVAWSIQMWPGPSLGILGPVHWICYGAPTKSRLEGGWGGGGVVWVAIIKCQIRFEVMGHRAFNLSKLMNTQDRNDRHSKCFNYLTIILNWHLYIIWKLNK